MVAIMKTYDVNVERDGKFWFVDVPAVKRATQARTLAEVEVMARDLIAIMLDVEPDSFAINRHIELPADAARHIAASTQSRTAAAEAQANAATEIRVAARVLKAEGLSLRDIGVVLDVSFQRASQLVNDERPQSSRRKAS